MDHHIRIETEGICSNKLDMYKSCFKLGTSEFTPFVCIMLRSRTTMRQLTALLKTANCTYFMNPGEV